MKLRPELAPVERPGGGGGRMPPGALVYRNPVLRTALFYRNPKKRLGEPRGLEYLAEKYPPLRDTLGRSKGRSPKRQQR